ncbi:hypothetical protein AV530_007574 [Patagioenas fasciata monilis]|uniref:Uncharacterized protein n=1 Tax=Patagioenas fasciata monilis TaxID=372326 RepID=A0A1V4JYB1_PATFA|nr:hypothetical protein AV530_007574 [Patagioenas fasciata monilis]
MLLKIPVTAHQKIETMKMMLQKKQIQAIFLFKLKMGRKAVETTCYNNTIFGPGTANERTVQCTFQEVSQKKR